MSGATVEVIASPKTWIESDAVQQLRATAALPGMLRTVGMPDLHPGKGAPIGAVFACTGWIYPYLIGSDIGCGMALYRTDLLRKAVKLDRWERRLDDLDGAWAGNVLAWLAERGVEPTPHDDALGTIGLGNHFAEVQLVEEVVDPSLAEQIGLDSDRLLLLVHSGSRGLGEAVLRAHVDRFTNAGLADGTDEQAAYQERHTHAAAWARANRALIAHRVLRALGADGEALLVRGSPAGLQRRGARRGRPRRDWRRPRSRQPEPGSPCVGRTIRGVEVRRLRLCWGLPGYPCRSA